MDAGSESNIYLVKSSESFNLLSPIPISPNIQCRRFKTVHRIGDKTVDYQEIDAKGNPIGRLLRKPPVEHV